jgi:hypothetical protein
MRNNRTFMLIFVLILSLILLGGCGLIEEVESIRITGSTEAKVGDEMSYQAIITPERLQSLNVNWSIRADDGEATINQDGLMIAEAAGTVVIVAELRGVEATLEVIITEKVQSVAIEGPDEIVIGDEIAYDIVITPEGATYRRAVWTILLDDGVAAITADGEVTAVQAGNVTIRVSVDGVIGRKVVTIIEQQD